MRPRPRWPSQALWAGALVWGWLGSQPPTPPPPARAADSLDQRRARVAALSPAEKEQLLETHRRFTRLDPAEQERLRRVCRELDQDENAAELRQVMRRYYEWLKTLPPYVQAELDDLPPEKRVARIKQMLSDERQRKGLKGPGSGELLRAEAYRRGLAKYGGHSARFFSLGDMEGVLQWLDGYVSRRGPELLRQIGSPQREELEKKVQSAKDALRKHEVLAMALLRWQLDHPGQTPPLTDEDLKDLRAKLSAPTRQRLESRPVKEQWRFASVLITLFVLQQSAARRADTPLSVVSEEELGQFVEKELSGQQRDYLLTLPGDEIPHRLGQMYLLWKLRQGSGKQEDRSGWEKRPSPRGPRPQPGQKPSAGSPLQGPQDHSGHLQATRPAEPKGDTIRTPDTPARSDPASPAKPQPTNAGKEPG